MRPASILGRSRLVERSQREYAVSLTENPATDPNIPPDLGLDEVRTPCRYDDEECEVLDQFSVLVCRVPERQSPRRGEHIALILSEWPHVLRALKTFANHGGTPEDWQHAGRTLERLGIE